MSLAAEELLAGGTLRYDVEIPDHVLAPGGAVSELVTPSADATSGRGRDGPGRVRLRPLTIADLQVVIRAAAERDALVATLMV